MPKQVPAADTVIVPPDAELAVVLSQFREPGAFCRAKVTTGNQGLALSLSFQPSEAQTASGALEVALRKTRVRLAPDGDTSHWQWRKEFLDFTETQKTVVERTVTYGKVAGQTKSTQTEVKSEFGATAKPPFWEFLAKLTFNGTYRRDHKLEHNTADQEKSTETVSGFQIYDDDKAFTLVLDARPHADLVARNTQLQRIEVVDVPYPSIVTPQSVRLDLNYQLGDGGDLEHAFCLRRATGVWRQLREDSKKRVLAELLMSKFLEPLHAPQVIWPLAEDKA